MAWSKLDRVLAALSGEKPDRTPIFDYLIHDGVFEHYLGRPVVPGEQEAILRASSECLDLCHPMPVAYEPREEVSPDGVKSVYERWMVWNVYPERSGEELSGSIKGEIEQMGEPDGKKTASDAAVWKEDAARKKEWSGEMVYISLGLSVPFLPGRNITEESLCLSDFPELCGIWNRLALRSALASVCARADSRLSPVAIIWNDVAMKGGLIYPPEVLEKYFFPGLNEMVSILHSKGIKVIFHSDGDVGPVFDRLVKCGIDGFNPLEISAGMSASRFFGDYGEKVTLVGGMDAVGVLALGGPRQVAEAAAGLMDGAGKDGRFIIGSTSGQIDNGMPLENVFAYFNAVWEYEGGRNRW